MNEARNIPFATATAGISDRVAFLRRTYLHLGGALVVWAGLSGVFFQTEMSQQFAIAALTGRWSWLLVLGAFMGVGFLAEKLAASESSEALQYVGLGLAAIAEAIIIQPMLWLAVVKFGESSAHTPTSIITQAALVTIVTFVGLTLTVFISKKDFSFLRGSLMVASFAAFGLIIASMIFGFSLGNVFAAFMIALMAGFILYQTSRLMDDFPPTYHVAAALMLFSSITTMFWYVLRLFMSRD